MKTITIIAAVIAAAFPAYAADATTSASATATATEGVEEPSAAPTLGSQVVQGCFSSWGDLIFNSTPAFNTKGACASEICYVGGFQVAATSGGNECYCGTKYPPKDTRVDDSNCNTPCPGYGQQACQYITLIQARSSC